MSVSLENIEKIIDRTKVSYKEAKETLEACNDDVVEAIIKIEQNQNQANGDAQKEKKDAFEAKKNTFMKQLKFWGKQALKLIQKAMTIKIVWKKENNMILELPLLIVVLVAIWTAPFSLIVLAAPFFFGIRLQLHRENGKVTDVNDWIKDHTNTKSND